jgi:hypothetical protein
LLTQKSRSAETPETRDTDLFHVSSDGLLIEIKSKVCKSIPERRNSPCAHRCPCQTLWQSPVLFFYTYPSNSSLRRLLSWLSSALSARVGLPNVVAREIRENLQFLILVYRDASWRRCSPDLIIRPWDTSSGSRFDHDHTASRTMLVPTILSISSARACSASRCSR